MATSATHNSGIPATPRHSDSPATAETSPVSNAPRATAEESPFELRGIVEGFYGEPWTVDDRLELLDFMALHNMNLYIYAPKDDPYQRAEWREPYPPAQLNELLAYVEHGLEVGVDFGYSISPGWGVGDQTASTSICYSCEEDFVLLMDKLEPMLHMGMTTVMLSFDDVWPQLIHREDKRSYGSIAEAQTDLASRLEAELLTYSPDARLLFTPTEYSGTEPSQYLETLRLELPLTIDVLWTGITVVSPTIQTSEARAYGELIGRPPLIWDNYPVNDTTLVQNVHFGPLRGRDSDLFTEVTGLLANPMTQPKASRAALATIADYLNNPAVYNPEASFESAILELAGTAESDLRTFALQCQSSALNREESVALNEAFTALEQAFDDGWWLDAAAAVDDKLSNQASAGANLPDSLELPKLGEELEPWFVKFRLNVEASQTAMQTLRKQRPAFASLSANRAEGIITVSGELEAADPEEVRELALTLAAVTDEVSEDPHHVHGARLQYYPNFGYPELSLYTDENVVWNFLEYAALTTRAWLDRSQNTTPLLLETSGKEFIFGPGSFEVTLPDNGEDTIELHLSDPDGNESAINLAVTEE